MPIDIFFVVWVGWEDPGLAFLETLSNFVLFFVLVLAFEPLEI